MKYTSNGDTNLSGSITLDDYLRTDIGFDAKSSGWVNGDFNYSGSVDFQDYALSDVAFNMQNGTLEQAVKYLRAGGDTSGSLDDPAMQMMVEHFSEFGSSYSTTFLSAVPEPAAFVPLALAVAGMLMSRPPKPGRRETV